jgi:hypothetical protein
MLDVLCAQLYLTPSVVDVRRIKLHQCSKNVCKSQVINDVEEKCITLIVKIKLFKI